MKTKRTNMKPEDRRNQIFECAQLLFFQKGYELTTVNDIMDAAGVSKGAFYHHFASKEAMIDGLMQRYLDQVKAVYQSVLDAEGLSAMERYLMYLEILRSQQTADELRSMMQVISALLKDENAVLQARLGEALIAAVAPTFSKVLRLGIGEGVFHIDDPQMAASLIARIANHHQYALKHAYEAKSADELEAAGKLIEESLKMQGIAIDRLLGIPDGTTQLRASDFASEFVRFLKIEKTYE